MSVALTLESPKRLEKRGSSLPSASVRLVGWTGFCFGFFVFFCFVCAWLPYLVHGRLLWVIFLQSIHEFCPANSSQFGLSYSAPVDHYNSGYGLLSSSASFCLPPAYRLVTTRTYCLVLQIAKKKVQLEN